MRTSAQKSDLKLPVGEKDSIYLSPSISTINIMCSRTAHDCYNSLDHEGQMCTDKIYELEMKRVFKIFSKSLSSASWQSENSTLHDTHRPFPTIEMPAPSRYNRDRQRTSAHLSSSHTIEMRSGVHGSLKGNSDWR